MPFYKRELSFGRKSKAEKPSKTEKPERTPRTPRRKRGAQDEWETPARRKLSFGRTKAEPLDETVSPEPKAQRAPKPKRERPQLRFARRPKAIVPGGKGAAKLVGLKIGSSQLAAARIQNGAVPELVQAVRGPLEPGIVVGGEVRDPEALAVALKDFFKRHKLPKRGVRLGIANNRIGVRTFDLTGIDDPKQLDNAVKFRAQEVLPIPIEEAVLDYQVLSEFVDADGQLTRRVLLVVAYRELVDRYLLACSKAGIQVVGIDLEAFALLRALAEPRAEIENDDRGALVAVAVGHERSTFAVSDGRACEFTRVLEWGGWTMNVAIARALDTAPSEAESIKRALSFAGPEDPSGRHHRGSARNRTRGCQATAAVVRAGARLLAPVLPEPARIPGYRRDRRHRWNHPHARLRRGAAEADRRARSGRRPARPGEGLEEARRAQPGRLARRRHRPRDRGLMRAVNLLPRDVPVKSFAANRGVAFGGVGGAALVAAVLATMTLGASGAVSQNQAELDSLRAQIGAVPKPVETDTSDDAQLAFEKGARVGALSMALGGRVAWDRVLRQVSLVLPEDVWLTTLSATAPSAAGAPEDESASGAGTEFTLVGSTYSQDGVARFLSRLSVVPDLTNVRLVSSQSELVGDREIVQFTLLADVRPPGADS